MRKKHGYQEEQKQDEQEFVQETPSMEENKKPKNNDEADKTDNSQADITVEEKNEPDYKQKAQEYYNHMQRLKAEFDNYRKRTQKEKEEIAKYASERIIVSLLPVLDNLERAIESAQKNKDFEAFSQGVEMIFRQFMKVLEDEGLKPIESVGYEFDPNVHEALLREASDKEENTILAELQKGYYLKDKVLRPSRVKVAGD